MKTRLITDPHFMHDKVKEYCNRPDNYEQLLFKWLQSIPQWDILICLWDICIWHDTIVHSQYIEPLQCTKILVRGNHDRKSNHRYLQHGWTFVCTTFTDYLYWHNILFSHQPLVVWEDIINIHWHQHNRRDIIQHEWYHWLLLSCEDEKYKPVTLERFLHTRWII